MERTSLVGIIPTSDAKSSKGPNLYSMPKVSILISNYNYASYLINCVKSVYSQTYANIEVIIVDDVSTDDSSRVLARLEAEHADLIVIRRSVNGGQSAAALDALERCSGDYVVLLDADDILLANAVECHIYTHISLRLPVGFTCGDMLQLADDALIGSGSIPFNRFIAAKETKFTPREGTAETVFSSSNLPPNLMSRIVLVDPWVEPDWVWSATSAMMFRRDALRFWEKTQGLKDLRYSTDAFFCFGINVITGSALIDMPVACYRIHGKNGFSSNLPLNHVRSFERGSKGEKSLAAIQLLLSEAQKNEKKYKQLFWTAGAYHDMIKRLKRAILKIKNRDETNIVKRWFRNYYMRQL
jgi:glycosyltransferase involved in cell wall biosynthesis